MLDAAFVRQHLEEVKANCRNRNVKVDVDGVAAAYDRRRQLIQQHCRSGQPHVRGRWVLDAVLGRS